MSEDQSTNSKLEDQQERLRAFYKRRLNAIDPKRYNEDFLKDKGLEALDALLSIAQFESNGMKANQAKEESGVVHFKPIQSGGKKLNDESDTSNLPRGNVEQKTDKQALIATYDRFSEDVQRFKGNKGIDDATILRDHWGRWM